MNALKGARLQPLRSPLNHAQQPYPPTFIRDVGHIRTVTSRYTVFHVPLPKMEVRTGTSAPCFNEEGYGGALYAPGQPESEPRSMPVASNTTGSDDPGGSIEEGLSFRSLGPGAL